LSIVSPARLQAVQIDNFVSAFIYLVQVERGQLSDLWPSAAVIMHICMGACKPTKTNNHIGAFRKFELEDGGISEKKYFATT